MAADVMYRENSFEVIHHWGWLDWNSAPIKTKMSQNSVLVQTHCFYENMLALSLVYGVKQ